MVTSVSIFFFFFDVQGPCQGWSGKGVSGPPSNCTTWGPAPKPPKGDLVWPL